MSKKKKLIPELRFPEFSKEEEWEEKTLGELTKVISKRNKENKSLPVYSINNKEGFLPQAEQFEGISSNKRGYDISQYKIIERNTFAYNPARINVGSLGYSGNLHNILISSLYVCFKTTHRIDDVFLLYFFDTSHFSKEVENNVEGGLRSYLFYQNFSNISISIPGIKEQQKIANCLTSLNELINAHSDKLEALKHHKKGLMQNLFPQEGKKVPNYRFPEFDKDGEWVKKELNQLGNLINGLTYRPKDLRENGLLVLRSSNIQNGIIDFSDCVFVRTDIKGANLSEPNDILICVRNGSKQLIGKNALIPKDIPLATHGAFMTVFRAKYPEFVFQLLQSDAYNNQVKADLGATINSINGKNFMKYEFLIPKNPKEQQKIASCLSAVDDLITAQVQKIEQLQQHKKGLMQGLFPKIES